MPTYKIHDNGGVPFTVAIKDGAAVVTKWDYEYDTGKPIKGPVVFETKYRKAWIGKHTRRYEPDYYDMEPGQLGNSILLQEGDKTYVWVGWEILRFDLGRDEEVVEFDSPVGNNDVPYPALFTNKRVLLMIEGVALPIDEVDPKQDPYAQYYGHVVPNLEKVGKTFRTKVLVKRDF